MCDKIVTLTKDEIRILIKDAISQGSKTPSDISSTIKKENCSDGKCDFQATGYILSVLKTMVEEKALISENQLLKINDSYVFSTPLINQSLEVKNKINISGEKSVMLSRTDRFLPAWSGLYVGQKIEIVLLPEPDNISDKNAVLAIFNGKHIGYLQREVAKEYHEKINRLISEGFNVVVDAEVFSSKNMGIKNCYIKI